MITPVHWVFGTVVVCWLFVALVVIAKLRKANPLLLGIVISGFVMTGILFAFIGLVFGGMIAAQIETERLLSLSPASAPSTEVPEGVREYLLHVDKDGTVFLDEEPIALNELAATMRQLKQSVESGGRKLVVLIEADEYAPYQSVVDVLNQLSAAEVKNVTFGVAE